MRPHHSPYSSRAGFTFIEVILYIALVSVIATTLLSFTLEISEIASKDRAIRSVISDGRNVSERLRFLIRNADGVDVGASKFSGSDGRLVLNKSGSSGTIELALNNGALVMTDGSQSVSLTSQGTRVRELIFENISSSDGTSHYIDFELTLDDAANTVNFLSAETTIRSGAEIRNTP